MNILVSNKDESIVKEADTKEQAEKMAFHLTAVFGEQFKVHIVLNSVLNNPWARNFYN